MADLHNNQSGRCWGCGYLLRGLESANCPECGRPFDRNVRSSMNFGRPMGRFGRASLAPLGWLTVVIAAIGCILVWSTVRWPIEGWRFSLMDVLFYAQWWNWYRRA